MIGGCTLSVRSTSFSGPSPSGGFLSFGSITSFPFIDWNTHMCVFRIDLVSLTGQSSMTGRRVSSCLGIAAGLGLGLVCE